MVTRYAPGQDPANPISERTIVFLVGAVQFVNVLDFVIVMPLGPDFALALDIPQSRLGYIAGSYAIAAAAGGVAGAFFLDRFDRRKALAVAMIGLVLATAIAAFVQGFATLIAARVLAGLFGGPATSLAFSIVADSVPVERRGKALSSVMSAFAIASVLGVPAGIELARHFGWRSPFIATACLGAVITFLALRWLPPMTRHLEHRSEPGGTPRSASFLRRTEIGLSYLLTAVVMCAGFLVIPNLSAHLQSNLGLPRSWLAPLYLVGGIASFIALRAAGHVVDRVGSVPVGAGAALALSAVLYLGLVAFDPLLGTGAASIHPATTGVVFFNVFMAALGIRNVAYHTLTSQVPQAHERAPFMSFQSAVQHVASAAGAFVSALILYEGVSGALRGVERVALLAIALTLAAPVLMSLLTRKLKRRAGRVKLPQRADYDS